MMKDMIPVFREGSLGPLDLEHVARLASRSSAAQRKRWWDSMATHEVIPTEGLDDLASCLRKLEVGQKMLFPGSTALARSAAANASAYGMHLRTHKSDDDGGVWIGRVA